MPAEFVPTLLRALVIGAFGGAGIILTQVYSRRGPLIFNVYAAILFALALFLVRAPDLGFTARAVIAFGAVLLSTVMSFVATLVIARRTRRRQRASGREIAPGHVPAWGFPLVVLILVTVSAGVAYVSS